MGWLLAGVTDTRMISLENGSHEIHCGNRRHIFQQHDGAIVLKITGEGCDAVSCGAPFLSCAASTVPQSSRGSNAA